MPFRSDKGVKIEFLGDSGPFSRLGTSICYRVSHGGSEFLMDCGVAVFSTLGFEAISRLNAVIATHSHEDHRRWFVDMALFKFYFSKPRSPLRLVASEVVLEEFKKNSRGGLERSLSPDSRRVVEIPFSQFVEPIIFGPMARYRVLSTRLPGEEGSVWRVFDEKGRIVSPHQAKVVVQPEANRPRMLFRDFDTGRWVEPESYYPFTEKRFYNDDLRPFRDEASGISFQAVKSTAWHGPSTSSIQVNTENEVVYFTSDTVFDPQLWKELATEVRPMKLDRPQKAFDKAFVIAGEINNFIEQTWSLARYERAMGLYKDKVLVHDVAGKGSVVHTDYSVLASQGFEKLLLTHSPDYFVSRYPLTLSGKVIRVIGDRHYEEVDGALWDFTADVYVKDVAKAYVGYKAKDGEFKVVSNDGILSVAPVGARVKGETTMRVKLFTDLKGRYFPRLEDPNHYYQEGPGGVIHHVIPTKSGGRMKRVESMRGEIEAQFRRGKTLV